MDSGESQLRPTRSRSRSTRAWPATLALVALLAGACADVRRDPFTAPVQTVSGTSRIFAADGTLITELEGEEDRESVSIDDIPDILQNAVVAIEDERFWEHNGVDPRGLARAARSNTASGATAQGGSTITQQYIKNTLLSPEKTIERKVEEATLAVEMEKVYSKRLILQLYLNTIFLGNRSFGVQVASKNYFGHPVQEVTLPEAALLAGLIQRPAATDPFKAPEAALERRNVVLNRMLDQGYITKQQHSTAKATPIQIVAAPADTDPGRYSAPHFVDAVKEFILTDPAFGRNRAERANLLFGGGLQIYTTVDLATQAHAEAALQEAFPHRDRDVTERSKSPDAALVSIEPSSGHVKAMVGGHDYWGDHSYAKVNLAMGKGRQVGSTFKPIVLAAALSSGIKATDQFPSPNAATIRYPGFKPWQVTGSGFGGGRANLIDCTAYSINTCYGHLIADERVGPEKATEFATKLGLDTEPPFTTVISEVLGTNDNTVLDMAEVYSTFANRGVQIDPVLVTKVVRLDGTVVYQNPRDRTKVLEPEIADTITSILEQGVIKGTGTAAQIGRPQAGKTGTTQNNTDAWFVGYTPELATAIWTGYAETLPPTEARPQGSLRTLPSVGGKIAAPVWASYYRRVLANSPPQLFPSGRAPVTTTTTVPPGNESIFAPVTSPSFVVMPEMTDGNTREATSAANAVGLRLLRVDRSVAGVPPGQVLNQSPAPGTPVRTGATVVIEATPGSPPPTVGVPEVRGLLASDAAGTLRRSGFTVTIMERTAPAGTRQPSGEQVDGGRVWQTDPAVGDRSFDGTVELYVQPGPSTTTTSTSSSTSSTTTTEP